MYDVRVTGPNHLTETHQNVESAQVIDSGALILEFHEPLAGYKGNFLILPAGQWLRVHGEEL